MPIPRLAAAAAAVLLAVPAAAQAPAETLIAAIRTAARAQLARQADSAGLAEPLFEVALVRTSRPLAPCAAPLAVEAVDTRQAARMRFAAVCAGSGGWRQEFVVR